MYYWLPFYTSLHKYVLNMNITNIILPKHSGLFLMFTAMLNYILYIYIYIYIYTTVTPINIYTNDTSGPILKVWYRDGTVE